MKVIKNKKRVFTEADKKAVSKRMKAYWKKRKQGKEFSDIKSITSTNDECTAFAGIMKTPYYLSSGDFIELDDRIFQLSEIAPYKVTR